MLWRTVLCLVAITLVAGVAAGSKSPLLAATLGSAGESDLISGEWEGTFEIGGGSAVVTLNFKLDGETLSGSGRSEHTGPGIISQGSMVGDQLKFTLNFEKHESIAIEGSLQAGQLTGEFRTEGMVGHWTARKKAVVKTNQTGPAANAGPATLSAALIDGEWAGTFEARGTKVPVTLRFKVDGDQLRGTSQSEHLGAGKISKGSWAADKLNFTMEGAFGSVSVKGQWRDGNLVGEFDMGQMHGSFAAKKK